MDAELEFALDAKLTTGLDGELDAGSDVELEEDVEVRDVEMPSLVVELVVLIELLEVAGCDELE